MSADPVKMPGALTVLDVDYDVMFRPNDGMFAVMVGDVAVYAENWSELSRHVTRQVRRMAVKVAVEFVNADGVRGTAYGIHASRNMPMIRWADGTTSVENVYTAMRPDVDVDEYRRLKKIALAAADARDTFVHAHRLPNLMTLVRAAIEQAVKTPTA